MTTGRFRKRIRFRRGSIIPASGRTCVAATMPARVNYVRRRMMKRWRRFSFAAKLEGIIPALEPRMPLRMSMKAAPTLAERSSDGHQSERARRQGYFHRRRTAWSEIVSRMAPHTRFAALKAAESKSGLSPSSPRAIRIWKPRRRFSRACRRRAPILSNSACRSAIRWPTGRYPARQSARLQGRHHAAQGARPGARVPQDQDNETPLVLMGYYNPIYAYGVDKFLTRCQGGGRRWPDRRRSAARRRCRIVRAGSQAGLNFIRLVTPTTDAKRLPTVLKNASGFLYYVSVTGITGSKAGER